jgi:hypothetical protein
VKGFALLDVWWQAFRGSVGVLVLSVEQTCPPQALHKLDTVLLWRVEQQRLKELRRCQALHECIVGVVEHVEWVGQRSGEADEPLSDSSA